jgi:hypothetical protein
MMTITHSLVGTLVVVVNGIAALWLFLLDRWGKTLGGGALAALWAARGILGLQVVLGVALVGNGAVGVSGHYLAALAALGAVWYAARRAATAPAPLRTLAAGCAATCVCALAAYLLAQR